MKYSLTSLGRVTQATCDIHILFISLLFFFILICQFHTSLRNSYVYNTFILILILCSLTGKIHLNKKEGKEGE